MWLNTDKMHYYLQITSVRKDKVQRNIRGLKTLICKRIVVSAEVLSRYVFRSDVAYDWNISMDELNEDTRKFKEDHLNTFSRKMIG